jgi:pimeloyl-[acyl-carrier protein] methyl ester esterase
MIDRWLLLPGWGFAPSVFDGLRAALPAAWQVEVLRPAAGVRDAQQVQALGAGARLAALVAAGGGAPVGVCGWSLGATQALICALRQPEHVAALVLVGATPRFVQSADWPGAMPAADFDAFAQLCARAPASAQARLAALSALGEREPAAIQRALRAHLDRPPDRLQDQPPGEAATFAARLEDGLALLRDTDLREPLVAAGGLRDHDRPLLLIHGAGDAVVPIAAARWLTGVLPRARLHELPQAGHAPLIAHTGRLVDAMIAAAAG